MASPRSPQSIFWSTITTLVDSELVTMDLLYEQAIVRVYDSAYFVLGKVAEALQLLQSENVGTAASITGSVNLTTFDFAAGAALSGLTLSIDEDTAAAQVVTFPNTITSIPLLLNELYTQAATNLDFEITDAGLLVAKSGTRGVASTMAAITGTAALALFGTQTAVAGSGLVNDGASRIGVGVLSGFPGGTLRSLLEVVVPAVEGLDSDKVAKAGDTMTGALVMSGASANLTLRAPIDAADSAAPAITVSGEFYRVPNVSQNSTYTLANPGTNGRFVYFARPTAGSGFAAAIRRADATLIATLPDTGAAWVLFCSRDIAGTPSWSAIAWGGNATNLA